MVSAVRILALVGTLHASVAWGAPCEHSNQIVGDPALVATVGELLARHGIANESEGCSVVRARLERRGSAIIVVRVGDPEEERVVSDPATAATVIETWSRDDFEKPLLASHPLLVLSAPAPMAAPRESLSEPAPSVPSRGVHVFGAAETSFADDRTSWVGAVVGVCVQLGRACASARGRFATVVGGPGMWSEAERHAMDLLIGGDIPFAIRRTTLSLGFGAGMGAVNTGSLASGMRDGSETFGLRADAHVAWAIPLGYRISIELSAAIDISQVTDFEGSVSPAVANEPRLFGRLGVGLGFGSR